MPSPSLLEGRDEIKELCVGSVCHHAHRAASDREEKHWVGLSSCCSEPPLTAIKTTTTKYMGGCLPLACQSKNSMVKRMMSVKPKTEHSEPPRTSRESEEKQTLNLPRLMALMKLMITWKSCLHVSRKHYMQEPAKATHYDICRFFSTKDTTWWIIWKGVCRR